MKSILVINGPNLDMLGVREPDVYGTETLAALEKTVKRYGKKHGADVDCYQSNSEGKLVNKIHEAYGTYDGIVYNPAAHTHYSIALRDAVAAIDVPVVEVHLSDVSTREAFRHVSVIAPVCIAQVKGLGFEGYCRAIDILLEDVPHERLGEGYERRYPAGNIIVAQSVPETPAEKVEPAVDAPTVDGGDGSDPARIRLRALRTACANQGLSAFYVRDTPNIAWLCAVDGVFDDERAHALLVAPSFATLHTDSRYAHAAQTALAVHDGAVAVNDARTSHVAFALDAIGNPTHPFKLGVEDDITVAEYQQFEERIAGCQNVEVALTSDLVRTLRAAKDADEVARMRKAQAITDAAFSHIVEFMRPGLTERAVQIELEDFMVRHGAEGLAFRSIVAAGENGADPHAVPGETVLEEGQCVVLDFGARFAGYCSDMTRTVFIGAPSEQLRAAYMVLREVNERVEAALAPGVTGKEMQDLAEEMLAENGYAGAMGHGLGHGVGREIHELPNLNLRNDSPLVLGNVVTVEPGIYRAGSFGMRLEDFGVITADGFEVFTQSTHDMIII